MKQLKNSKPTEMTEPLLFLLQGEFKLVGFLKCLSGSQGICIFKSLGDFKKICNIFYKSKI